MNISVENIPAVSVVYMRRVGAYGEQNFKLMQRMKEWVKNQSLWDKNAAIYTIAQDNPAIVPPEKCRYDVCYVTEQVFDDDVVHHGSLPAGAYLICKIPHTSQDVQCFWDSFGDILANKEKQLDVNRPVLERYQLSLVENGYCEMCIPIVA